MPQPIRKACTVYLSGLDQRPLHAAALGRIIAISGKLEASLGWLLSLFSGGSAETTIAMFHAVVSTDAQRAMLQAAAEQTLSSVELNAFGELMEDFRPRYGERSRLVHNLWGHSDEHPDKAIWCRSADYNVDLAKFSTAWHSGKAADSTPDAISLKCMTYTVKDLDEAAARLREYSTRVTNFVFDMMDAKWFQGVLPIEGQANEPASQTPQSSPHQLSQTDRE